MSCSPERTPQRRYVLDRYELRPEVAENIERSIKIWPQSDPVTRSGEWIIVYGRIHKVHLPEPLALEQSIVEIEGKPARFRCHFSSRTNSTLSSLIGTSWGDVDLDDKQGYGYESRNKDDYLIAAFGRYKTPQQGSGISEMDCVFEGGPDAFKKVGE